MKVIELIVTMVIVGVLAAALSMPLLAGIDFWEMTHGREEMTQNARYGLERMVRDLTWIQDEKSFSATTENRCDFTTLSSGTAEGVAYGYNAPGNPRSLTRNGQVLIGPNPDSSIGVEAFAITFYNLNNQPLAIPIQPVGADPPMQLWRVHIDLTVGDGSRSVTLSEEVYPRALDRSTKGMDAVAGLS